MADRTARIVGLAEKIAADIHGLGDSYALLNGLSQPERHTALMSAMAYVVAAQAGAIAFGRCPSGSPQAVEAVGEAVTKFAEHAVSLATIAVGAPFDVAAGLGVLQ